MTAFPERQPGRLSALGKRQACAIKLSLYLPESETGIMVLPDGQVFVRARELRGRRLAACRNLWRDYAQLKPCFERGSDRIRFPVSVKIALHTAGRTGGNAGSPRPVGALSVCRKSTSI